MALLNEALQIVYTPMAVVADLGVFSPWSLSNIS